MHNSVPALAPALHRRLMAAESVNEEQILEQAFMYFDRDGNKEISIAGVGVGPVGCMTRHG